MRNTHGRLTVLSGIAAGAILALAAASPAAAQFGGLKKKLKSATSSEAPAAPAAATPAEAPAAGGGAVVLTADVVEHLIAGLKAGQAEREAARKEDTPYGRYLAGTAAYEAAREKCQAAQQSFPTRMAANQKLMDRYDTLVNKMVEAQGKGDNARMAVYQDSAMAMQDPSCVVKQPSQPDDYYEAQRKVDARAEKTAVKSSGLSAGEYAMGLERTEAILRGNPPPDASASEKSAVSARASDLKPLLGIRDQPAQRAAKPAPAPAPAPVPQPAAPRMSPAASAMSQCMAQNSQKHQKEIEALGERAQKAQQANDMARMMAIADTLQQLQMAGCGGGR